MSGATCSLGTCDEPAFGRYTVHPLDDSASFVVYRCWMHGLRPTPPPRFRRRVAWPDTVATVATFVGTTATGELVLEYLAGGTSLHRWKLSTFRAAWEPVT